VLLIPFSKVRTLEFAAFVLGPEKYIEIVLHSY
jgi:hypothetical protein